MAERYQCRLAVRAYGGFNIQTQDGVAQGIGYRYCKNMQRADGYGYSLVAKTDVTGTPPKHGLSNGPRSAPGLKVEVSRANLMNNAADLEYVGFWIRMWASLIDTLLLSIVLIPLMLAIYGGERLASGVTITGLNNLLISYILPAIAVIAFWSVRHATPGKMVFRAHIVDARTGNAPTLKQHIIRYLGYFISAFFFCLGFLWIAFDSKKQGWHDKLAGTVVVRQAMKSAEPVRFE